MATEPNRRDVLTPSPEATKFFELMDLIIAARDEESLLDAAAKVRAAFPGSTPTDDYAERWAMQWLHYVGEKRVPLPEGTWPN